MPKQNDVVSKVTGLSASQLQKKSGAFLTCLIAGFLLVALALGAAVYLHAARVDTFETLLLQNLDPQALGTDEGSIRSFARETIFYITGAQETWNPQITVAGLPASGFIPQSFYDHMKTVQSAVKSAQAAFWAGAGIVVALLGYAVIGAKKGAKKGVKKGTKGGGQLSFSLGGYYVGAGVALLLILGIGLWSYLDFQGFWAVLHQYLIPDGIFSAAEPIMQLFPLEMFAGYLEPVFMTFGLFAVGILLLPLILFPVSKLLMGVKPQK